MGLWTLAEEVCHSIRTIAGVSSAFLFISGKLFLLVKEVVTNRIKNPEADSKTAERKIYKLRLSSLYGTYNKIHLQWVILCIAGICLGILYFCSIPLHKDTDQAKAVLQTLVFLSIVPPIAGDFILTNLKPDKLLEIEKEYLLYHSPDVSNLSFTCESEYSNKAIRKYCDIVSHVIFGIGTSYNSDRVQTYKEYLSPLIQQNHCDTRLILEMIRAQRHVIVHYGSELKDISLLEIEIDVSVAIHQLFNLPDVGWRFFKSEDFNSDSSSIRKHLSVVGICSRHLVDNWLAQTTQQDLSICRCLLIYDYLCHLIDYYERRKIRKRGQCLLYGLCSNKGNSVSQKELMHHLFAFPVFAWNQLSERYHEEFGTATECKISKDWENTYLSFFRGLKRVCVDIEPNFWNDIDIESLSGVIQNIHLTPEEMLNVVDQLDVSARQSKLKSSGFVISRTKNNECDDFKLLDESEQWSFLAEKLLVILKKRKSPI